MVDRERPVAASPRRCPFESTARPRYHKSTTHGATRCALRSAQGPLTTGMRFPRPRADTLCHVVPKPDHRATGLLRSIRGPGQREVDDRSSSCCSKTNVRGRSTILLWLLASACGGRAESAKQSSQADDRPNNGFVGIEDGGVVGVEEQGGHSNTPTQSADGGQSSSPRVLEGQPCWDDEPGLDAGTPPATAAPGAICAPGLRCVHRSECIEFGYRSCESVSCTERSPVCSCGGHTYDNACAAMQDDIFYAGECLTEVDGDMWRLKPGVWGGRGIRLELTALGGKATFNCGTATLDEPPLMSPHASPLGPKRPLSWKGRYAAIAALDGSQPEKPVAYEGDMRNPPPTLTVTLEDGTILFSGKIQLGAAGSFEACP
jgi:hypothetical protein